MDHYETPTKGIIMILLIIAAFLLGAFSNAYLARRKYNTEIGTLKKAHYKNLQDQHTVSYNAGLANGKALEIARQDKLINEILLDHTF